MSSITPVVLCGGSGTRLWPLSRKSFPKQFVPIIGGKSLLVLTLNRLSAFGTRVVAVTGEEHRFLVADALREAGMSGTLLLEGTPRNTAAAMALAALRAEPEALLLFCPADHHIPDSAAFARTIHQGVSAAKAGMLVTFGVVPSFPSTAYGYIRQGAKRDDGSIHVAQFIEKPEAERARQLLLEGDVLWNAGIFLTRADALVKALHGHAPDILECCRVALAREHVEPAVGGAEGIEFVRPDGKAFEACRSESIDFAVMERHPEVAVVPFAGQWNDVGSWNAVADLAQADAMNNRVQGKGLAHEARNTYIHAPHRPVVALGTHDLLIIDTPDAVLVARRDCAEQVKDVVALLDRQHSSQVMAHRKVMRPWGWYDSVDAGERFQVKRIGVKPGGSLSLQKHAHRAEHWIVVRGTAEITKGDSTFELKENESTYIAIGEVHRLRNPGDTELEIIEVQSGSYLGEDDIVRFDDRYGRTSV